MMQGRFHLYEGYTQYQVTLPINVMALLGIKILIITNAAGGINDQLTPGKSVFINLLIQNDISYYVGPWTQIPASFISDDLSLRFIHFLLFPIISNSYMLIHLLCFI